LATVDSVNCTYIGEITGLTAADVVTFSTTNTGGIKGQASAVCPGGAATGGSYIYAVSAGLNYVGLLINETI
jgi:type II secretory pathway pseudopilin PulG